MENWDILIGVLLVIVFVLLVQRVASPFRCESGEEEKNGGCVSNSTKERWWAFWEEPKCKRGELQADYTCLASMIMDAMSPGAASSPQAATPAVDTLQAFNRLVGLVERNFLNMSTGPVQEFTVNIGVANACPIQPGAKVNVNVTIKQAFDQQGVKEFQNVVTELYNGLNGQDGHGTPDEKAARRNATTTAIQNVVTIENLMSIVTSTINYQNRLINIAECGPDTPIRLDEHFVATAIVGNILVKIGQGISGLIDKMSQSEGVKTSCPTTAAVMTLGSDGKPNGILTGPGQTITRGTADTYVPGKVRMFSPIAIDGVGKQAGTAFHTQLLETPCEGTDVAIGDWAKFDVQKPTQSEGVNKVA